MNDFYEGVVVIRQLIRYQSIEAEHPYLRGMKLSVEIQYLGINVKLIYYVYQDPTRMGLVVEVNSEESGATRKVYSRALVTAAIRAMCPWGEWTERPRNWLIRLE